MCCGEPLAGTFSEGAVWLLGGDKLKGGGKEVMKLGACFGLRAPQPEAPPPSYLCRTSPLPSLGPHLCLFIR